jgi:hypothetical protein
MNNEESIDFKGILLSCFKSVSKLFIILAILWGIGLAIYSNTEIINNIFWNINNIVLLPIKYTLQNIIYYIIAVSIFVMIWLSCAGNKLSDKDLKNNLFVSKYITLSSFILLIALSLLYDKTYSEAGEFFVGTLIFFNAIGAFCSFMTWNSLKSKSRRSKRREENRGQIKENKSKEEPQQLKLFD